MPHSSLLVRNLLSWHKQRGQASHTHGVIPYNTVTTVPVPYIYGGSSKLHSLPTMFYQVPVQTTTFTASHIMSWVHKKTLVALVCEWTITTERPPLVGEISANFCRKRASCGQRNRTPWPYSRISRLEPLLFLPSSSLLDPVSDPLLLRNSVCTGNRTQNLWICSQELYSHHTIYVHILSINPYCKHLKGLKLCQVTFWTSIITFITHHFHSPLACALEYQRIETKSDYTLVVNNCIRRTLLASSLNDRLK
jgi:hypothetical protein